LRKKGISCVQERNILHTGKEYPTYSKRREANGIGHILHRNCSLKLVVEGKVEGMGRQGRRYKQLLAVLKEWKGYWKLKEETLDHAV
jgi:hypothetical protein